MRILLVEDNPGDVRLLRVALAEAGAVRFTLTHVDRLDNAINRLADEPFDVVLLDLSLPDSQGLETFTHAHENASDVPIIVLTGTNDETLAVKAVQAGAQDYLVKGQADGNLLMRAMRYAIERHRMQMALRSLSLVDDLTGLYNRRGFLTLAEQHMKLACRMRRGALFIYADLDGLKEINDTLGHQEGDWALMKTAELLKETFRGSDILARMGGDEFAVIAFEASEGSGEIFEQRLQEHLDLHNAASERRYPLSISLGMVYYDPAEPSSLDELLAQADALMYEQKRRKKAAKAGALATSR